MSNIIFVGPDVFSLWSSKISAHAQYLQGEISKIGLDKFTEVASL